MKNQRCTHVFRLGDLIGNTEKSGFSDIHVHGCNELSAGCESGRDCGTWWLGMVFCGDRFKTHVRICMSIKKGWFVNCIYMYMYMYM
jgi:hypothetical protein